MCTLCLGIAACKQNEPAVRLNEPQNLQMDGRTLIWDEDENASCYVLYFNFTEHTTYDASFDLSELFFPNTYQIELMAVGDGKNFENSYWTIYSYTPEEILPYGYDERGLKYTLLEDESGYEVSRGSLSYNDSRLSGYIVIPDYFCGLPVKAITDGLFASKMLNIDKSTGYGCNTVVTGVHLPKKLETIGEDAFVYCISLEEINIPDTVTEIGEDAFAFSIKLKEIHIPSGLKIIEDGVFNQTNITKVVISDSVVSIGMAAFGYCTNLTEVILPNNLESIDDYVFVGCSALREINAPQTVVWLGKYAFKDCSALPEIPVFNHLEYMGRDVFEGTAWYESQPDGFVIYAEDILYRYKGALPEGGAINNLPSQIQSIAGGAFAGLSDLTSIYLPDGVKLLGEDTFSKCTSLTDVRLPQGLTDIKTNTFRGCSLQFIEIPDGVKSIEDCAFNCNKLTEIVLPASLEFIEHDAFFSCKITTIFFKGTPAQWDTVTIEDNKTQPLNNPPLKGATICYYSESEPTAEGNYWHYVDGKPVVW